MRIRPDFPWRRIADLGGTLVLLLALALWMALPPHYELVTIVVAALWLAFTRPGRQALAVTQIGIGTLGQRRGSSAVVIVGTAGVVAVLVSLLAMAEGYRETMRLAGSVDTVVVLRGGSTSEVVSMLTRDDLTALRQAPGIARNATGDLVLSEEIVVAANLPLKGGEADDEGSVQLRGIGGDAAWAVRSRAQIVSGRRFNFGLRELVVGASAARQFQGLVPGREIKLGGQPWTVTGVFATGDVLDSEIWADAPVVADTYRRGANRTSATLKLADASSLATLKSALDTNPHLKVDALTTTDFYRRQSESVDTLLRIVGLTVGSIMAIGAVFGALNTMYATVASRVREIGTLRAIGFTGLIVVVAVLLETMLLSLVGGLVGTALAYEAFNGYTASTTASSVGQTSFALRVTFDLMVRGLVWALAIGFVGGLLPALAAARMSPTAALREH